jgi:hypothetical protein
MRRAAAAAPRIERLLAQRVLSETALDGAGVPSLRRWLVSIGGGLGSFALVGLLRVCGVPPSAIAVLGRHEWPHAHLRELLRTADTPDWDRLRSDSASRIDNPWGFPGYAWAEARAERSLRPLVRVLLEPLTKEHFAPRAATVYSAVEREARRVGWASMLDLGEALAVRRLAEGGFAVLHERADGELVGYRCDHVHLALGYGAPRGPLRASADAPGGSVRVWHAFEPHEELFATLARRGGGTVVVQGAGMTAARAVERLLAEREELGMATTVVQVVRGDRDGVVLRPFVYPRSAHGGPLHERLCRLDPEARAARLEELGRASAPFRRCWQRRVAAAKAKGAYRVVREGPEARAALVGPVAGVLACTGLAKEATSHPLVADLLTVTDATTNTLGCLVVDEAFEVLGAESPPGRLFASGVLAAGNHLGPVDSFFGLQFAAFRIARRLAAAPQPRMRRLAGLASVVAWWRFVTGREP